MLKGTGRDSQSDNRSNTLSAFSAAKQQVNGALHPHLVVQVASSLAY